MTNMTSSTNDRITLTSFIDLLNLLHRRQPKTKKRNIDSEAVCAHQPEKFNDLFLYFSVAFRRCLPQRNQKHLPLNWHITSELVTMAISTW